MGTGFTHRGRVGPGTGQRFRLRAFCREGMAAPGWRPHGRRRWSGPEEVLPPKQKPLLPPPRGAERLGARHRASQGTARPAVGHAQGEGVPVEG